MPKTSFLLNVSSKLHFISQGNKNSFPNRCSELEVIRWKLQSTKLECVILWHPRDNCRLAVLFFGSQPSHPLLKASDRKKARQNRNVNKVIFSYVNARKTSRFLKLLYLYVICSLCAARCSSTCNSNVVWRQCSESISSIICIAKVKKNCSHPRNPF